MCETERFIDAVGIKNGETGIYFPPTYDADGFIHASSDVLSLLPIANHFYTASKSDWICLKLSIPLLEVPVKFEAPAPVGNIESYVNDDKSAIFPHIYGGIKADSVVECYRMNRHQDGQFLSIESSPITL